MRGDADHRIVEPGNRRPAPIEQFRVAIDVGDEARLPRLGCRAPEAGMGVKRGQERQADPGRPRAAAMLLAISAGSANGRPPRSWCT